MINSATKGEAQQQQSRVVCLRISKVLDLIVDRNGKGPGHAGNAAANHQHHSELTHSMGKGKHRGSKQERPDQGQQNPRQDLAAVRAQQLCGLQDLTIDRAKARGNGLHGKGQAEDDGTDQKPGERERQRMTEHRRESSPSHSAGSHQHQEIETNCDASALHADWSSGVGVRSAPGNCKRLQERAQIPPRGAFWFGSKNRIVRCRSLDVSFLYYDNECHTR